MGLGGKYGFYESVDYTPSRLNGSKKCEVIKTFMAHHQGLILLSINNMINANILKKRFNLNPEIESVNILLQEKMPVRMIVTKEKKEKIVKHRAFADSGYFEKVIENKKKKFRDVNVLSNNDYKVTIFDDGQSVSEYKGLIVNNYKSTAEISQGINFYIRNLKNKNVKKIADCDKIIFPQDKAKFIGKEMNLNYELTVCVDPDNPVEIRTLKIVNTGKNDEIIEVVSDFEPVLSRPDAEYSHPAFNKMFLKFENENENIIMKRISRDLKNEKYLLATLYTEENEIMGFEYEIDYEKYQGRENYGIPDMLLKQKAFSSVIGQNVCPVIALKRTIKVKSNSEARISLILAVGEDKENIIKIANSRKSNEEIDRIFGISKAKAEEQNKFLRVNTENARLYFSFLKFIYNKYFECGESANYNYSINNLWKYGISGDLPIVAVKISKYEEAYVLEDIIKAYEYYRTKNILLDLIIFNNEKNVYEKFVNDEIETIISERQLNFLRNVSGGIFVLNVKEISEDDYHAILVKANVFIDAKKENLVNFIKEADEASYENEYKIKENNKFEDPNDEILPLKKEELIYDNGFGGFIENGKEYFIYKNFENKLPSVWSNVLANSTFGTIVTDNLGGYIWDKNSRLNRVTAWNNNSVLDFPSEIYYLKDEKNGKTWTLNSSIRPSKNYYYIKHGFGYSSLQNSNDNLISNVDVFVPIDENIKILNFKFKNLLDEKRNIKFLFFAKVVLGEDELQTTGNIVLDKINENIILAKNVFANENFKDKILFISSNEKIESFTGNKNEFFGNGGIENPDALYKKLEFSNGLGVNSCIAIEFELEINQFETKEMFIQIGSMQNVEKIKNVYEKYKIPNAVNEKMIEVKNKWNNILSIVNVKTPSDSINIMMNGWLVYQTISSRIFARTGYYQSGGAYGFRDQIQDCLGLKYVDINFLKEQILNCCRHQFYEGDVLHWWHQEIRRGIRTRFSDDMLWLVYGVLEYIEFTNNYDILNENVEYIKGEILQKNELEKYEEFHESELSESVFEHCIKSIENVLQKGIDPFPKIGIGDWNDGFSNIGSNGNGESIWLGFFLYDILNRFIPICKKMEKNEIADIYTEIKEKLKIDLNTKGWDGRWYKRAIDDSGNEIGSINNDECRIDSISQSWAVISNAGDNDKKYICMDEAERHLVDVENKIIKLFEPPFENGNINPGYIKAYPSGVRENGGQYTHASCWMIIAEAMLGFGDKAVKFAEMINPIEHSKTKDDAKKFKLEPYIMEADIYSNKSMIGRGGWNWYTGSSSWYFKSVLEYILGFKIKEGYLYLDPCVPSDWKEFEIHYKYKTTNYNIFVKNINGKINGIEKFIVNGEEVENKKILLYNDGKIYNIQIFI